MAAGGSRSEVLATRVSAGKRCQRPTKEGAAHSALEDGGDKETEEDAGCSGHVSAMRVVLGRARRAGDYPVFARKENGVRVLVLVMYDPP